MTHSCSAAQYGERAGLFNTPEDIFPSPPKNGAGDGHQIQYAVRVMTRDCSRIRAFTGAGRLRAPWVTATLA